MTFLELLVGELYEDDDALLLSFIGDVLVANLHSLLSAKA